MSDESSSSEGDTKKHKKHKKEHKHKKSHKKSKSEKHESSSYEVPEVQISSDDYFLRSKEFKHWLKHYQGTTFDKLTSKESRSQFDKFVKSWNKGKLDKVFYNDGIEEQQSFTSHKWSFVKKLNDKDTNILASARDSVHVATNKAEATTAGVGGRKTAGGISSSSSAAVANVASNRESRGGNNAYVDSQSSKADEVWKSLGLEPGKRVQIAPRSD